MKTQRSKKKKNGTMESDCLMSFFLPKYLGLLRGWGSAGEPQVPVGKACHQPRGQQPSGQVKMGSSKPGSTWKSGSQLHCAWCLWVQTWLCSRGGCKRACLHALHDPPEVGVFPHSHTSGKADASPSPGRSPTQQNISPCHTWGTWAWRC